MAALSTDLRTRLGNAIVEARKVAEGGARQAIEALAVDRREAHGSMAPEARTLRNRLRAHSRQLGDARDTHKGTQTIPRLVREVAYEHWHRMLFARFLAENHLLIEPVSGVAITMDECEELARERREDPWALAASFAQGMLPQIFRADDPALALTLPPETRQALQKLLSDLPSQVFTEGDSLGWTYQYWQSAEKKAVNARVKSGEKITGDTLPAVTQLFTEHYMVQFLLHNTIGAWHAGRVLTDPVREAAGSERDLRAAVRLDPEGGYDFEYLRFVRESEEGDQEESAPGTWRPAAGTFDGWPKTARELTVLDPCCGSGHFMVAAFELLVRLRMQEEGLELAAAVQAVIADNLFALELDARCTQIAAFNLALAAWKMLGAPIPLPPMHIACSGIGPQASRDEWIALAEEAAGAGGMPVKRDLFGTEDTLLSAGVRGGLEALYDLFEKAPELGSLIDPRALGGDLGQLDALQADFTALEPLLEAILKREGADDEAVERAVAAKGMADAAEILLGPSAGYTLVLTNVPYLGRGSHSDKFKAWADIHEKEAKNDLATIFVSRMLRWVREGDRAGTVAAVTPQSWLFLTTYRKFRERLLKERTWEMVARLGPGAFETIGGQVVNVALITLSGSAAATDHIMAGVDVAMAKTPGEKAGLLGGEAGLGDNTTVPHEIVEAPGSAETLDEEALLEDGFGSSDGTVRLVSQVDQLGHPDARVLLTHQNAAELMERVSFPTEGLSTGDGARFLHTFWEHSALHEPWVRFQTSPAKQEYWSGMSALLRWDDGGNVLQSMDGARVQGHAAWGRHGVLVARVSSLRVSLYGGDRFDKSCVVITPRDEANLPAIWAFAASDEFVPTVRRLDTKPYVTTAVFGKIGVDIERWSRMAEDRYPNGLPEPYSDDPTQWLFHGHPAHAERATALQVGVSASGGLPLAGGA